MTPYLDRVRFVVLEVRVQLLQLERRFLGSGLDPDIVQGWNAALGTEIRTCQSDSLFQFIHNNR